MCDNALACKTNTSFKQKWKLKRIMCSGLRLVTKCSKPILKCVAVASAAVCFDWLDGGHGNATDLFNTGCLFVCVLPETCCIDKRTWD